MRVISGILVGLIALGVAWAVPAFAESPLMWQMELKAGPYKSGIDGEFANSQPFETIYGEGSVVLGMIELDLQIYRGAIGSLAIGGTAGIATDDGTSLDPESETKPGDTTNFNVAPLQLSLVYQLDQLATYLDFPIVIFAKGGVDYWLWWIRDANDDIATYNGMDAIGGTFGWHVSGGVRLLLDWFDPATARGFDEEVGVNHSYLFGEFMYAEVDDFGSNTSFRLGDMTFFVGLSFEL